MDNLSYVTYDSEGHLTGSFLQALQPEHVENYIEVTDELRLNWCAYKVNDVRNGLVLLPPAEPSALAVPQTVTRRQARQALLLADLLDDVPAAIQAIPDLTARRMAQIEWEDSLEFVRSRPLVIQVGAALGLDAAALDQLFVTAAGL